MAHNGKGKVAVNVGVVYDDDDKWLGKMGLSCVSMAISDFYASHTHYKTRVVLHSRDSKNDIVGAAAAAVDLLKNVKVQAILGPTTSMQANFVINLGEHTEVPVISYSATSPSLSLPQSPYFIRATLNDSSQVKAIGELIKAFGWREVVPIYVKNEYGKGIMPRLIEVLQNVNTRVPYQCAIHPSATDDHIVRELLKLKEMESRVFIVHMTNSYASRLFTIAKQLGMMKKGFAWIITTGVTHLLNTLDPSVIDSMQGVLGIKSYALITREVENFAVRWKKKFQEDYPIVQNPQLNAYGLWAYDAATALAMAVEKVGYENISDPQKPSNINSDNLNEIESLVVSEYGKHLRNILSKVRFKGLTGDFHMIDGQLQSSSYKIVNVIDDKEREVGVWTPQNGIVRSLDVTQDHIETSPTSGSNLDEIIWPGFTTNAPKSGIRKLRVGVPKKAGYYINVIFDPITNKTHAKGFCIDLFDAVMQAIPYHVPYEYVAFVTTDGRSAGDFNELVDQVFTEKFDAVVGDITIIANRSKYVDFTLPFTESGVALVVPTKDKRPQTTWVFLKPLTWDLWVASVFLFTFIAFVIWALEHRTNSHFGGSPSRQFGTSLWFSFSTMVFAHREKVVSHLARFVVIIWCFVVLILTQSYTASFTSMLTVEKLEPTITNVQDLVRKGETVGYPMGSFVKGMLKQLNVDVSKLKQYDNFTELDKALSNGTKNGGFAAAFDETPYIKLFCALHCPKYTIVEVIQNTSGFGFAFPKGSPLVADVSRAILNVTQDYKTIKDFSRKWISWGTECQDPNSSMSSNSIGLGSFGALFLIVSVASCLAIIIDLAMLLYDNRNFLFNLDIRDLLHKFLLMHAFSQSQNSGGENGTPRRQTPFRFNSTATSPQSPRTPSQGSPSAISYDTERNPRDGSPLHDTTPRDMTSDVQLSNFNHGTRTNS